MKSFILLISLMIATPAAFAICPKGMKTSTWCKAKPDATDNQVMKGLAEKIGICTKGKETFVVVEADGQFSKPEKVKVTPRTGANSYDFAPFSLSIGTRPYPNNVRYGTLYYTVNNITAKLTFECYREVKYYRANY